ncbi:hypothetical protein [Actinokineospora sp. NBRC 105648]|nr:hypothetical protein [Actinokineospora sp. NBRC 105648]GLZ36644.1 hypothetical protein Acsp05_02690 [Actinokineospora sp. NBRC 105648]
MPSMFLFGRPNFYAVFDLPGRTPFLMCPVPVDETAATVLWAARPATTGR